MNAILPDLPVSDNPLSSNRGVEMGKNDCHLDWLSASYPLNGVLTDKILLQGFQDFLGVKNESLGVVPPRKGFVSAMSFRIGRIDFGEAGLDRYIGFVLTGDDLVQYRALGGDEQRLLAALAALQGKPSRLDVALNVHDNPAANIGDLIAAHKAGEVSTRAKAARRIEDLETGGETLYLGSRKSNLMFRAYNKAIESGNLEALWTRLELEAKGRSAVAISEQVVKLGLAASCRFWFEKFGFQVSWFRAALDGLELTKPHLVSRPKSDRRWWFENQVLPALRKMRGAEQDDLVWFIRATTSEFLDCFAPRVPNPPTLTPMRRVEIFAKVTYFCLKVILDGHR